MMRKDVSIHSHHILGFDMSRGHQLLPQASALLHCERKLQMKVSLVTLCAQLQFCLKPALPEAQPADLDLASAHSRGQLSQVLPPSNAFFGVQYNNIIKNDIVTMSPEIVYKSTVRHISTCKSAQQGVHHFC